MTATTVTSNISIFWKMSLHNTQAKVKRVFDLWLSTVGLMFLSPIMLLIAGAIKLDYTGPVFFLQERIGKNQKGFLMYKFRTMVKDAPTLGLKHNISADDPRTTRLGKFLRKYSLDELPQTINILRGEMSIIGPRPTLRYQVEQYNDFQRRRLQVKPGITGWAQVNGRNLLTWEDRIKLDVWYVENYSLTLDMDILRRTVSVALSKEGLYGRNGINLDFGQ